jgi:hypothetical protein
VLTPRTRAVICVHLAGWPCDMDPIMALAERARAEGDRGLRPGARRALQGAQRRLDRHMGAWSFCQDKIMTTGGEGGMVTTNDEALWSRMWSFKDHGKSYAAVYEREHPPGFRWLHEGFGTNWRMLEMQAAVGRIQLRRMADWTARRNSNAMALAEVCSRFAAIRLPVFRCQCRLVRRAVPPTAVACMRNTSSMPMFVQRNWLRAGRGTGSSTRSMPARRAMLPGLVFRGLPGESLRQYRLAAGATAVRGAGTGGNLADVPRSPDLDRSGNRQGVRGAGVGSETGMCMLMRFPGIKIPNNCPCGLPSLPSGDPDTKMPGTASRGNRIIYSGSQSLGQK